MVLWSSLLLWRCNFCLYLLRWSVVVSTLILKSLLSSLWSWVKILHSVWQAFTRQQARILTWILQASFHISCLTCLNFQLMASKRRAPGSTPPTQRCLETWRRSTRLLLTSLNIVSAPRSNQLISMRFLRLFVAISASTPHSIRLLLQQEGFPALIQTCRTFLPALSWDIVFAPPLPFPRAAFFSPATTPRLSCACWHIFQLTSTW